MLLPGPYCQKIWMTLEEKRIPYEVEKINMRCYGEKPRDFGDIQPSGNVPVAIIDGKTYGDAAQIVKVLEKAFPNSKPLEAPQEYENLVKQYSRLEKQLLSAWMYWVAVHDGGGGIMVR